MHELKVDHEKCKECGTCEKVLPGFRTEYDGLLLINNNNVDDLEIAAACRRVMENCLHGAIVMRRIKHRGL